jgi:WD40 repeat protein
LRCVTINEQNVFTVFDPKTGRQLRHQNLGDGREKFSFVFSPGGGLLAYFDYKAKAIVICDGATGAARKRLTIAGQRLPQFAFSPDDRMIAIAAADDTIKLRDPENGTLIAELSREGASYGPPVFSPDGQTLAVIVYNPARESGIDFWNLETREIRYRLDGPRLRSLIDIGFSPDGKYFATCGQQPDIILWDSASGNEVRRFRGFASNLEAVFSPDGRTLAVAHNGGTIQLFDVETGQLRPESADPHSGIWSLQFSKDGKRLLGQVGGLRAWDPSTGRELSRFPTGHSPYGWVALSPDERTIARIDTDGLIQIANALTGDSLQTLRGPTRFVDRPLFTPDNRHLVAADNERNIAVWDIRAKRIVATLSNHQHWVSRLAVSPDGKYLASASQDAGARGDFDIRLWDMATYQLVHRFVPRRINASASAIAFSPDSRLLAAVGGRPGQRDDRGDVQVWDIETGKEMGAFEGHTSQVRAVAFSPDNRMIATGGQDRTLRLWELATGAERHRIVGHKSGVHSLAFSPDGRRLAAASSDAPVYFWDVLRQADQPKFPPTEDELNQAWRTLTGDDPKTAFQSICRLVAAADTSVPFLCERLKPVATADAEKTKALIRQLDDSQFAKRQSAEHELRQLGDRAVVEFRAALAATKSAEVRETIQRLFDQASENSPETLRAIRAVEILENAATPNAREHLQKLSRGAPGARLTEEAAAAVKRLSR